MPTMLANGEPIEVDANADTAECYDCGDVVERDTTTDVNGDPRCESCYGEYYVCEDCDDVTHADDVTSVNDGDRHVCDGCASNYSTCDSCSTTVPDDDAIAVAYSGTCCMSCYENGYAHYCDSCGGYYWDDDGPCCHRDCDCEAPRQRFAFPANGGEDTIENDERANVTLAAGIITSEGLGKIRRLISDLGSSLYREARDAYEADGGNAFDAPRDWDGFAIRSNYQLLASDVTESDSIGNEWTNGRGNYTRRLRRHAHQNYKISLPDALITEVGNIARAQSMGTDVAVEFTRDLNQSADDFYHSDSCWWSDYSESRCSLKSNGGIGMRTFGTQTYPLYGYQTGPWADGNHAFKPKWTEMGVQVDENIVTGRAWVMPVNLGPETEGREYDYSTGQWATKMVRKWEPTFDSTTPDGYIVFNGYGDLSDYAPARIVAEMTGLTYRKVGFECDPMYVNNGGYLVTSKTIMDTLADDVHITINADTHSNLHQREMTANAA